MKMMIRARGKKKRKTKKKTTTKNNRRRRRRRPHPLYKSDTSSYPCCVSNSAFKSSGDAFAMVMIDVDVIDWPNLFLPPLFFCRVTTTKPFFFLKDFSPSFLCLPNYLGFYRYGESPFLSLSNFGLFEGNKNASQKTVGGEKKRDAFALCLEESETTA